MENIYQILPLRKESFFQRLFKQQPKENALIELNNLLAVKSVNEISFDEVNSISLKYKINLVKEFPENLLELYAASLKHFLKDKKISNDDIEKLRILKQILALNDFQIESIHNQLTSEIYEKSYKDAVADGRLSDEEDHFLENLKNELRLPDSIEKKISNEVRSNYMNNFIQNAISDERLSPSEIEEIEAIGKSLNVNISIDDKTLAILDRYKLYWVIENGEIPSIDTDLNLQQGEVCYFKANAQWYEYRSITKRINYGGPIARIRIMKGLYYRVGSISVNRITSDELKLINSGELYLTNKRLIFIGTDKNSSIKIDKILSFSPYIDGVEINKETGKSPTIMFNDNVEMFCILLSRLMKEN
jgi:hypothetical protein